MEVSKAFLELEKEVIIKLLDGTDDILKVFREQYYRALVKKREFSVMGFFTLFEMPEDSPLSEPPMSIQLGDVVGQLDGVKNGIKISARNDQPEYEETMVLTLTAIALLTPPGEEIRSDRFASGSACFGN